MRLTRRTLLAATGSLGLARVARAAEGFAAIRQRARGQRVYFNHWGGSPQINDYIAWAGTELLRRFGVELVSVKVTDIAETVGRVLAEKTAGRNEGGSVDLVWINGENFAATKRHGLLYGPITPLLPNFALVDTVGKPTTLVDFTVPTEGFEAPWGMAHFVLFHDAARLREPPRSLAALLGWARGNPGRSTFPAPPDFVGTTFLKHVLYATIDDPRRLARPAEPEVFEAATAGSWTFLEALRPHLWRAGRTFPANKEALHQLLDDGEVDLSMAFNPAEASSLILAGRLPPTTRTYLFETGTIANTHFLAVPFNATAAEGALVAIDFLLSPEAQARKQDERIWGDPTVLDLDRLEPEDRARFERLERGPATLPPEALRPVLPEPHPSWTELLEAGWARRFARG